MEGLKRNRVHYLQIFGMAFRTLYKALKGYKDQISM